MLVKERRCLAESDPAVYEALNEIRIINGRLHRKDYKQLIQACLASTLDLYPSPTRADLDSDGDPEASSTQGS